MSMSLAKQDLAAIIEVMESLEKVPAEVNQVTVSGHTVFMDRVKGEHENMIYVVRGITDKNVNAPVYRDR